MLRRGEQMSEPLALAVLTTLSGAALLGHADDPPRGAVGGCLGALVPRLPPAHRDAALLHHVLAAQPAPAHAHAHAHQPHPDDWLLQHGRSAALFVALKEAPHQVRATTSYLAAPRLAQTIPRGT